MKRLLLAGVLATLAVAAGATHITDKLVVGLYAEQKLEGEPERLLTSGTPVEVIERGKGVVQVRLADDTRGWLEARYVSEEKPAAMKLLETQAELRRLKSRLRAEEDAPGEPAPETDLPSVEQIHAGLALNEARTRIGELEAQLADLPRLRSAAAERDALRGRLEAVREALGATGDSAPGEDTRDTFWDRYLPWILAGLMALLGFAAGVGFIDYRIRRRYGGFRL